ncbi:MAG: hypothetical protein ACLTGJ_01280 [Faecalibacterium prausnitzii]
MNITDFLDYLHKTRGWQLDADYYSQIENMAAMVERQRTRRSYPRRRVCRRH